MERKGKGYGKGNKRRKKRKRRGLVGEKLQGYEKEKERVK